MPSRRIETTRRLRDTLAIAVRVALLIGPLAFAVLALHFATLYRASAQADHRPEWPSVDLPRK